MLTVQDMLDALETGAGVPGRHVVLSAHPDDETISFGGALTCLGNVQIVQLTDGISKSTDRAADRMRRFQERSQALAMLGRSEPVLDSLIAGRESHEYLQAALAMLRTTIPGADVLWTHPYEGGHIDHDSAAWLAQTACAGTGVLWMEFASYHSHAGRRSTFGAFWPDPSVLHRAVTLTGARLTRKLAAIRAYGSQAHILRKFPTWQIEPYRHAPVYDFSQPPPPPFARWDTRGYQPSTTMWRRAVAEAEQRLMETAA